MSEINTRIVQLIQKNPWMTDAQVARAVGTNRWRVSRARAADLGLPAREPRQDTTMFTEQEMERLDKWLEERGLLGS